MKDTLVRKIVFIVLRPLPFKSAVVFQSFNGQYNDNPKYISERLFALRPDIRQYWVVSEKGCSVDIPEHVKKIAFRSKKYYYNISKCAVVIDNMTGIRGTVRERFSTVIKNALTSEKQLNISTWHGTPIKKIGLSVAGNKKKRAYVTSCDFLIAGCTYTQERLLEAFHPIKVINCGTPRNDLMVRYGNEDSDELRRNLKVKLGLPPDKKVILFAPTYRNTIDYSGLEQMNAFDFNRICDILHRKFGDSWIFVFRVHHEVLMKINTRQIAEKYPGLVYDGNSHDDMADYLLVTDVLITDYSGSIFDFALTGKPGFLYTPDQDYYINEERGTYISLDELPYPHAAELDDFYRLIENYDEATAKHRIAEFNQHIGNAEDGQASEKIARAIIKFMETGEKENIFQ